MFVKLWFVVCCLVLESQAAPQEQTNKSTRSASESFSHRRRFNPVFPSNDKPSLGPATKKVSVKLDHNRNLKVAESEPHVDSKSFMSIGNDMNSLHLNKALPNATADPNAEWHYFSDEIKLTAIKPFQESNLENEMKLKHSILADPKSNLSISQIHTENPFNIPQALPFSSSTSVQTSEAVSASVRKSLRISPDEFPSPAEKPKKMSAIHFNADSIPLELHLEEEDNFTDKTIDEDYYQVGPFETMNRPRPASPTQKMKENDIMAKDFGALGKALDASLLGAFAGLPPPTENRSVRDKNEPTATGLPNPRQLHSKTGLSSRNDNEFRDLNFDTIPNDRFGQRIRNRHQDRRTLDTEADSRIPRKQFDNRNVNQLTRRKPSSRQDVAGHDFDSAGQPPQIIHQFQSDVHRTPDRREPAIRPALPRGPVVGHSIFVNSDPQVMPRTTDSFDSERGRFDRQEGPIIIQKGDRNRDKPVLIHLEEDQRRRDHQFLNSRPSNVIDEKFGPAFTVIHGHPGQPDIVIHEHEHLDRRPRPDQRPTPDQRPRPDHRPRPDQRPTSDHRPRPDQRPIPDQSPSLSQKPRPDVRPRPDLSPDISYTFQPDHLLPSFASPVRPHLPTQINYSLTPTPQFSIGFSPFGRPLPTFAGKPIQPTVHNVAFETPPPRRPPKPEEPPAFPFFPDFRPTAKRPAHLKPVEDQHKFSSDSFEGDIQKPETFSNLVPQHAQHHVSSGMHPVTYRPHFTGQDYSHTSLGNDSGSFITHEKRPPSRFPPYDRNRERPLTYGLDRPRPIRDEFRPHLFNKVEREYSYGYAVNAPSTGDHKAAYEVKGPDGVVRGQYSLLQPDGFIRVVTYRADEASGFKANVEFIRAYLR